MSDASPASEPTFDEAQWDAATTDVDRASALIDEGALELARTLAAEAATRLLAIVGATHPDFAQALVTEGDALSALGQLGLAEERFARALAIHDLYTGEDADVVRPYRLTVLGRLGYLWSLDGRYAEAEACLREAIAEAMLVHGEGAPDLAEHYNTLGVCLRFAGRYGEAREVYQRAAELRAHQGIEVPASHFHNLSGLATARGDHTEAEGFARMAIAARRAGEGFGLATDLCGLGDALVGLDRAAEAEAAYREALALFAASPRPDHPEVAFALHNLADALVTLERPTEAQAVYREAIARKVAMLGPDHHEVAATLNNLAALLADLGQHDEACATAARAVAIVELRLPADHPVSLACRSLARSVGVT